MPGIWFESHVDLRDHPKTDLLMDVLCITRRDAIGLLHMIWGRAMQYAPSGDLSAVTDAQIARWADWDGAPSALVGGLMTAGFLDGSRVLHDWEDYAGRWIEARAKNAEKQRQYRAKHKPEGAYPSRNGVRNGHVGGLPDLTGPNINRTGPDPTPLPPSAPRKGDAAGAAGGKRRTKHSADIPRDYAGALCPAGCGTTHGGPTAEQELRARWLARPGDDDAEWADFAAAHGRRDLAGTGQPSAEDA